MACLELDQSAIHTKAHVKIWDFSGFAELSRLSPGLDSI
jgi:hypothetical protein